jgi:type VI protein secretion system component VasK
VAAAVFLWAAAVTVALADGHVAAIMDRALFGIAAAVTAVLVVLVRADRQQAWRLRSLECQVRKLQARDEARAEGENLVIQFARGAQPRVGHPAGNGNGHGPA